MSVIKILVIGELCTDKFVYGDVNRMCPEAPVPVLNPKKIVENDGMAGNVVSNIKALMSEDNCEIIFWHQPEIINKTRFVHEKTNHMIMRLDEGETSKINSIGFISPQQRKTIRESDIVIISDYNKGFLTENDISHILSEAKLSIIDTKKILSSDTLISATFIKLNEVEFKKNNHLITDLEDKLLITLGEKGVRHNGKHYPSPKPQDTIDVSGAGDTFTASFILKYYLSDGNIGESIKFANEVCSDVVNKKGVALPSDNFKFII
jgi:D-beta-D-heptose 7-phosphate kinase/D-beta-D-heptose 1-phosphate adenosyltransferase